MNPRRYEQKTSLSEETQFATTLPYQGFDVARGAASALSGGGWYGVTRYLDA